MIRINLLSDREAIRKETSRQQVSVFILMVILTFAVLAMIHFTQVQRLSRVKNKVAQTEQEVNKNKLKVGEVEKFKKDKKDLEEKLNIITKLQQGKTLAYELMMNIEATIPDKMWFEKIIFDGMGLSLDGFAIDDETIAKFMKDLEISKAFSNVDLDMTEMKDVEGIPIRHFSLKTRFTPPAPGSPEKQ